VTVVVNETWNDESHGNPYARGCVGTPKTVAYASPQRGMAISSVRAEREIETENETIGDASALSSPTSTSSSLPSHVSCPFWLSWV
jgi:hypothetical protein